MSWKQPCMSFFILPLVSGSWDPSDIAQSRDILRFELQAMSL